MARTGDGKQRSDLLRRDQRLSKRVTEEEARDFAVRARVAGFSDAQAYLAAFILGQSELARIDRKAAAQLIGHLGKVGSNLNQIAYRLNAGGWQVSAQQTCRFSQTCRRRSGTQPKRSWSV